MSGMTHILNKPTYTLYIYIYRYTNIHMRKLAAEMIRFCAV